MKYVKKPMKGIATYLAAQEAHTSMTGESLTRRPPRHGFGGHCFCVVSAGGAKARSEHGVGRRGRPRRIRIEADADVVVADAIHDRVCNGDLAVEYERHGLGSGLVVGGTQNTLGGCAVT